MSKKFKNWLLRKFAFTEKSDFYEILYYENLELYDNYYAYNTSKVFTWIVVVFDNYNPPAWI